MTTLPLPKPPAADLWLLPVPDLLEPEWIGRIVPLLAPDEAERLDRFLVRPAREEFLLTRLLVRSVLSRYASIAPGDWRFVRNERGRPELSGPIGVPWPAFNLSNCSGLIACLVRSEGEVGVDVEPLDRRGDREGIAERFFAPEELRALAALPKERQRLRFLEYWTLKEAYIKARGLGLAIPLDRFAFDLDSGPGIRVSFDPRLGDDPAAWHFALEQPTSRHLLAWAIRSGGEARPDVRTHRLDLADFLTT
jgi:4'-phosphopantetheinyl transferase